MKTLNLQDVLEIHRITCAEQYCSTEAITGEVAKLAAAQIAEENSELGKWLTARAEEMDQPVALWQIRASLQQHGVN